MPWRESSPMSERLAFVTACLDRSETIVQICDRFGISEKTGQKWLRRFREHQLAGLVDRSRARLTHPYRIAPEIAQRIIALRRKYPLYGPVTLGDYLRQKEPQTRWPSASAIGKLLSREKLVRAKRRHQSPEQKLLSGNRARALEPNSVWTADFKGHFRLKRGRGEYCYPLTVLDLNTHFLLGCEALLSPSVSSAKEVFVSLFREYGLPEVLRTDNGVPFAQPNALGRLGALGFWWVRLGIRPEHITPARPQENGSHERFHRTLKAAATKPASASLFSQQKRFDRFRAEYNNDRPHQGLLGHQPPGKLYRASVRPYPNRLPSLVYPENSLVRLVSSNGNIKWKDHDVFLSSNLAGEYVSLTESEGDLLTVGYSFLELGELNATTKLFSPRVRWSG